MPARNPSTRVKDLMARNVVTVRPDDPLVDAVSLMHENRVSAVPVVDKRMRCQGILSTTDLVALLTGGRARLLEQDELDRLSGDLTNTERSSGLLADRTVADVMTGNVIAVSMEDTVLAAAREMLRSRVHRLVVVDPGQRVIGILSTMDLLAVFAAGE